MSRAATTWSFLAVLVMAVSLGPSFAHVLEAPPRLTAWPPELWREATVFHGQFAWFALVGAPLDVGSILLGAAMAVVLRHRRPAFGLVLAATVCYAVSLATWLAVVAPMNAVLAQWEPGPVPETFEAVRNRWEAGHIAITPIKFVGLCCVIAGALSLGRQGAAQADRGRR